MAYTTLISVEQLRSLPVVCTVDCSFDLADPSAGWRAYQQQHIPGAVYAHLDDDLSGPKTGRNGRHPLPGRATFAATAGRWGIGPGVQVVCCDAQGGPYAARAWWLLKWLGHAEVAVLDGGLQAWRAAGGALGGEPPQLAAQPPYPERGTAMPTIEADALQSQLGRALLIDARSLERFRGDTEPLDPVAGHIPGANHRFFKDNLAADGRFRSAAELRGAFESLGATTEAQAVHMCGSGVTACHNLLAMAHAGLAPGALYAGSWSEWCADPARPVARG